MITSNFINLGKLSCFQSLGQDNCKIQSLSCPKEGHPILYNGESGRLAGHQMHLLHANHLKNTFIGSNFIAFFDEKV